MNYIVVLPYQETSRMFHASKTTNQEAFIGENGVVYYQSQAMRLHKDAAIYAALKSENKQAFVREVQN